MNRLPKDISRLIGCYLDIDDITKLKFIDKCFTHALDEYFFKLYWKIHCPEKYKAYYKKYTFILEDISYFRRCEQLKLIIAQNEILRQIITLWNTSVFNITVLDLREDNCIGFCFEEVDSSYEYYIIFTIFDDMRFEILTNINNPEDNEILINKYNHISLSDIFLDIVHDQYLDDTNDLSAFKNKKLLDAKLFLYDGIKKEEVVFALDKINF